jgi:hypothetical protein
MRNLSKEQTEELVKKIIGPPKRGLAGKEYDQIWLLLQMLEPIKVSNNQRTWTDEYELNGKRYDVIYGLEDRPIIEVFE